MPPEVQETEQEHQQQGQEPEPQQPTNGQEPESSEESSSLSEAQLNQLPDWARESISRANNEAAKYRTERNTYRDLVKKFETPDPNTGQVVPGEERLKQLHRYTTTPEGVREIFEEIVGLDNAADLLDIPEDRLRSLLAQEVEEEHEESGKSTPLTQEDFDSRVQAKVNEVLSTRDQQQHQQTLTRTVMGHLKNKGYTDNKETSLILQLAAQHQDDVPYDPVDPMAAYVAAVEKGIEDFESWKSDLVKKQGSNYVAEKKAARDGSPRAVSGTTPPTGEQTNWADLDWDEIVDQATEAGYFG